MVICLLETVFLLLRQVVNSCILNLYCATAGQGSLLCNYPQRVISDCVQSYLYRLGVRCVNRSPLFPESGKDMRHKRRLLIHLVFERGQSLNTYY